MIYSSFETDSSRLLIWEIAENEEELKKMLTNFEHYSKEFESIKTNKRRLEFLVARIALNIIAKRDVEIQYDSNSKPYCIDNYMQISISHSSKWVAVIVHQSKNIGIDIEIPDIRINKLYKRFLSTKEQLYLYNKSDSRKIQLAWSAKEALYKIIGNDAVDFAEQLEICDFTVSESGHFEAIHLPTKQMYHLQYKQFPEFNLVYCLSDYQVS